MPKILLLVGLYLIAIATGFVATYAAYDGSVISTGAFDFVLICCVWLCTCSVPAKLEFTNAEADVHLQIGTIAGMVCSLFALAYQKPAVVLQFIGNIF